MILAVSALPSTSRCSEASRTDALLASSVYHTSNLNECAASLCTLQDTMEDLVANPTDTTTEVDFKAIALGQDKKWFIKQAAQWEGAPLCVGLSTSVPVTDDCKDDPKLQPARGLRRLLCPCKHRLAHAVRHRSAAGPSTVTLHHTVLLPHPQQEVHQVHQAPHHCTGSATLWPALLHCAALRGR